MSLVDQMREAAASTTFTPPGEGEATMDYVVSDETLRAFRIIIAKWYRIRRKKQRRYEHQKRKQ